MENPKEASEVFAQGAEKLRQLAESSRSWEVTDGIRPGLKTAIEKMKAESLEGLEKGIAASAAAAAEAAAPAFEQAE
jgi:hypothetical protein